MKPEEWGIKIRDLRWEHRGREASIVRERKRLIGLLKERAVQVRSDAIEGLRETHLERVAEDEAHREAVAGGYNVAMVDGELQVVPDRFGPYSAKGALRRVRKYIARSRTDEPSE